MGVTEFQIGIGFTVILWLHSFWYLKGYQNSQKSLYENIKVDKLLRFIHFIHMTATIVFSLALLYFTLDESLCNFILANILFFVDSLDILNYCGIFYLVSLTE